MLETHIFLLPNLAKSGTATENQEAMKTEIVYLEFALSNCPEDNSNSK